VRWDNRLCRCNFSDPLVRIGATVFSPPCPTKGKIHLFHWQATYPQLKQQLIFEQGQSLMAPDPLSWYRQDRKPPYTPTTPVFFPWSPDLFKPGTAHSAIAFFFPFCALNCVVSQAPSLQLKDDLFLFPVSLPLSLLFFPPLGRDDLIFVTLFFFLGLEPLPMRGPFLPRSFFLVLHLSAVIFFFGSPTPPQ